MLLNLSIKTKCLHCGTDFFAIENQMFCCAGCNFVFDLIQEKGLDRFYEIKSTDSTFCPIPVKPKSINFDFLDDPNYSKSLSQNGTKIRFFLKGLNCTACIWLLESLPKFCADAHYARLNLAESTIEVVKRPEGSFSQIAQSLNQLGYSPQPLRETENSKEMQMRERRADLIRIGVAAFCTGNIMIFAVSIYGGASGILAREFNQISAMLALPVLSYCALPFFRNALKSLTALRFSLDLPIVAAILSGTTISIYNLFNAKHLVYFDSLSMLVFLLLSSRFLLKQIQIKHFNRTNIQDELLFGRIEKLNDESNFDLVSTLSLKTNDLIRINSNIMIPVDGTIESGSGLINTAVMTGESEPIQVSKNTYIEAGSRNLKGEFTIRVNRSTQNSRFAQILRDTEEFAESKSHFVHLSEKISNYFILSVLICAGLLVFGFFNSNPAEGFSRALTLVIVTCPCVFGIAIPLSMNFAIKEAARSGMIVKSADAIEKLWNAKNIFIDKTGTLTTGEMSVLKFEKRPENTNLESRDLLNIAYTLEHDQLHPVARAISNFVENKNFGRLCFSRIEADSEKRLNSGGVSAKIDGQIFSLRPIDEPNRSLKGGKFQIHSYFGLFCDHNLLASFQIGDAIRPEAAELIRWAKAQDLNLQMISGDRKPIVENCAQILGLNQNEFQAEMGPEAKASLIKATPKTSIMIGDGANDAPALANAGVGIAICGSLDVSLRAADIYLTQPNLESIIKMFKISKLTKNAIYRNLMFSVIFNVVSGFLAATGEMTPLIAAVLMPVSSLSVLMSSLWTKNQMTPKESL